MRVLAIDDDPRMLEAAQRAIASATGPDGKPYEVTTVRDHREASRLLENEYFDVVIIDVGMGGESEEGLAVLRELTGRSTITIVLTACPSFRSCVASVRAGAWDYLDKGAPDSFRNLVASLEQACRHKAAHPDEGRTNPDAKWVHEHLGELMEQYAGEVVAVLYGKVLDHDKSYGSLQARIEKDYPITQPMIVSIPDMKVEAIE